MFIWTLATLKDFDNKNSNQFKLFFNVFSFDSKCVWLDDELFLLIWSKDFLLFEIFLFSSYSFWETHMFYCEMRRRC
ncbi:MAG: hypothetical protein K2J02_00645, partial [Malacoplasma sp.]|nr:hypothetical protein [Malacoplasma sp.]